MKEEHPLREAFVEGFMTGLYDAAFFLTAIPRFIASLMVLPDHTERLKARMR